MTRPMFVTSAMSVSVLLLLVPAVGSAQTGIAGVVRDTSGAVLPGVSVEAASPALIEKVRTVVTDAQGLYSIVDLRPGVYEVTFTLAGFSTVKRQGIELVTNFTATVNADLRIGPVEETVTVSGQSPVVDIRNVVQDRIVTGEVANALAVGRTFQNLAGLVPGMTLSGGQGAPPQDVGGLVQANNLTMAIHGGRTNDMTMAINGFTFNSMNSHSANSYGVDAGAMEETSYALGAISAETSQGGVWVNMIPKEGGNTFSGSFLGSYTNSSLQSDNLTDSLRARGLTAVNGLETLWDINPSFGGPLKKDKLWFFGSFRYWGFNQGVPGLYYPTDPNSLVYTPDPSRPALDDTWRQKSNLRLTWQISPRHKLGLSADNELRCICHRGVNAQVSPQASQLDETPISHMMTAYWSSPVTNRLLLTAGVSVFPNKFTHYEVDDFAKDPRNISILEQANNFRYRSAPSFDWTFGTNNNVLASASYVTGSHSYKVGIKFLTGIQRKQEWVNGDMNYTFLNGVPRSVLVRTTPLDTAQNMNADLGIYAQDQWTFRRVTMNLGIRYDYLNSSVPAQQHAPVRFVGERNFAEVPDVPNWHDINPRLGFAYDLFGNGKTAVKVTLARYVAGETVVLAGMNDPLVTSTNSATRTWNDRTFPAGDPRSGNFVPDCDFLNPAANGECGAGNANFGKVVTSTHYDDAVLRGFGKRGYNWETSFGIQHELLSRVGLNASYFRRTYGNFLITDNHLTAADYSTYCITAPVDARLPGGGGNGICGLYDVSPSKVSLVGTNDLVTFAKNYGKQFEHYNGLDVTLNARLQRGVIVQGGLNFGRSETNNCDVVVGKPQLSNSAGATLPRTQEFCDSKPGLQPQVKFLGTYPLPWDVQAGATFQTLAGPQIVATRAVPGSEIAPSLGRNLAAGANGTVNVSLIPPATRFDTRLYQLDLRVTKTIRLGKTRARLDFDMANLLNANPVLTTNTTYGSDWLRATAVLPGRLLKFGARLDF